MLDLNRLHPRKLNLTSLDSTEVRRLLVAAFSTGSNSPAEGHASSFSFETAADDLTAKIPAAVLVAVVGVPGDPGVVLTRRTANLENHAGEVSLPGGRVERQDANPRETALRETFEEIGLPPEKVEVLGRLPFYDTVSGFRVAPYVGWVEPPVSFCPDPREVEEIFLLPLALVLDRDCWRREEIVIGNTRREFWVLQYEGRRVWGATAGILTSLAEALKVAWCMS
ncbi:MAG: CoA pyrophosphatase [Thermoleophilia bacterium]|nr:CoA pyrophosphatase [Thermoleophilia bacterium]